MIDSNLNPVQKSCYALESFLASVLIKMHCIVLLLNFKQFNNTKLLTEEQEGFLQKKDI